MEFKTLVFYFLSAVLVLASLRVITARNPVHAVLFLVLAFFSAGGVWLLLQAEFLAITLILVYVGAVMVLFLFVIMMLDINIERLRQGFWNYLPVAALVGVLMAVEMIMVLASDYFRVEEEGVRAVASNTKEIGRVLYTDYVYPFELAAVVLLLAIVAAIALTLRGRKRSKFIDPAVQVAVKRADRVRMVSMPAEKEE